MREVRDRRRPRVAGEFRRSLPPRTATRLAAVQVVVHVDGGARGNPGTGRGRRRRLRARRAGARRGRRALGTATNNVAEYRGAAARARARGARSAPPRSRWSTTPSWSRSRSTASYKVKNAGPQAAARRGAGGAARVRALVDPLGPARARTRPPDALVEPRAGRGGGGGGRAAARRGRRHRLRALPADRRPARAPAAADARRARRAAVHRRPPGLRALVQADPARADGRARRAARPARRTPPRRACGGPSRSSGCCSTSSRCSRR